MISVEIYERRWPLREPFAISRGVQSHVDSVGVTIADERGGVGRGESCGVDYLGETAHGMRVQIESIVEELRAGASRIDLLDILPSGGARHAVDAALWDLAAKQAGKTAFSMAGIAAPRPVKTTFTIGIRDLAGYYAAAAARADYPLLKIKVKRDGALEAVEAVRCGAPNSKFVVDPNQSWRADDVERLAPALKKLGVILLEQPIPVGNEKDLKKISCSIPLCADELINSASDLPKAKGLFDVINIKLEKSGGLTAALQLAAAARSEGFELMVGCMAGSSLAMAPSMVLAQICEFVDLDGPLLQCDDWADGLVYREGIIALPSQKLWG